MQCRSSGSFNIRSSSVRNSSQGEGSCPPKFSTGILKVLQPHICQQIPVCCVLCPILSQPFPFTLCAKRTVKHIFLRKTTVVECIFKLHQLSRSSVIVLLLS